MGKPHKLANARIEIDTALPPARAIDVARQAVGTQRALKITGEGEGVLRVQVNQGLISAPVMTFTVSATSNGGRTSVVSAIDEYRTSQTTVYFVPVTSKSMEGIGVYRRFMVSFGQAMQASDPSAQIQMIERDLPGGSAPAPVGGSAPVPLPAVPLPAVVPEPVPQPPAAPVAEPVVPVAAAPAAAAAAAAPASAPAAVPSASVPQAPFAPAPAAGAPLLSESNARIVQIVGGVILVAGLIFWYATPSNVTVGPLLVILLGAVVAGVGFIIGRNAGRAAADELAAKLRNERAMAGISPTAPVVPLPPSAPAVPMPPATAAAVPLPAGDQAVPAPPAPAPTPPHLSAIPPVPLPTGVPRPSEPVASASDGAPVVHADPIPQPTAPPQSAPPQSAPPQPSEASAGPIRSIPGLAPSAAPAPAPAPAAAAPTPTPDPASAPTAAPAPEPDDLDATRISPVQSQVEWELVLADGRRLAVASALRIGRDPIADPALPGTVLVSIDDPAKSLSKTHAQLEAGPGVIVVTDLHSTNGTRVGTVADGETRLAPEVGHRITGDAEIAFGDYVVRLQRQAAL